MDVHNDPQDGVGEMDRLSLFVFVRERMKQPTKILRQSRPKRQLLVSLAIKLAHPSTIEVCRKKTVLDDLSFLVLQDSVDCYQFNHTQSKKKLASNLTEMIISDKLQRITGRIALESCQKNDSLVALEYFKIVHFSWVRIFLLPLIVLRRESLWFGADSMQGSRKSHYF